MPQIIVITGATSGIGEVAATHFARTGARIVLIARDRQRADVTLNKLRAMDAHSTHTAYFADLSSIDNMKRVAAEIATHEPVIDVLINNAGAVYMNDTPTVDGLAPTFATNHLAYYVLTLMLLPRLRSASNARIICTSSRAHGYAQIDFDHLQRNGITGYAQSKLMNLLFVRRLSQLLQGESITVNAFHPGFVATRFADNTGFVWRSLMQLRKSLFGLSPEEGARTLLYLAQSPEVNSISGRYYIQCQSQSPSRHACNDADAQRLWKISAEVTGIDIISR